MTAFRAAYADWRVIKTRACIQVVFEVPIEHADQAYQVLGGMPMAANEIWCAVARLDERKVMPSAGFSSVPKQPDTPPRLESNASAGADNPSYCVAVAMGGPRCVERCEVPKDCGATPLPADKPKKSPAQIAGYLCTLGSFQEFLRVKFIDQWIPNAVPGRSKEEVAKETLYDICAVTSRTQLTKDNTEWLALQLAFRLWETEAEVVPA